MHTHTYLNLSLNLQVLWVKNHQEWYSNANNSFSCRHFSIKFTEILINASNTYSTGHRSKIAGLAFNKYKIQTAKILSDHLHFKVRWMKNDMDRYIYMYNS